MPVTGPTGAAATAASAAASAVSAVGVASSVVGMYDPNIQFSVASGQSNDAKSSLRGKEADQAANNLGYSKTNYQSHGQPVYKKGNKYISPDADAHTGGIWKMADSVENLRSKSTRMGTYDAVLNRIGD